MKEIHITEEELEYYSKPLDVNVVSESPTPYPYKEELSFEEESKDCITLEEFSRMWDELIENDPRLT